LQSGAVLPRGVKIRNPVIPPEVEKNRCGLPCEVNVRSDET